MRTKTGLLSGILVLAITTFGFAAPAKSKASGLKELGPGAYQATVKAIVCDGCGEFIQKTMAEQKGIGIVLVDQKAKLVTFRVQDDARIKVADLQKALKASADRMGMGADYTLQHIKRASAESVP